MDKKNNAHVSVLRIRLVDEDRMGEGATVDIALPCWMARKRKNVFGNSRNS